MRVVAEKTALKIPSLHTLDRVKFQMFQNASKKTQLNKTLKLYKFQRIKKIIAKKNVREKAVRFITTSTSKVT